LSRAYLNGVDLRAAHLSHADLSGADLTNAHLDCLDQEQPTSRCANLAYTNMRGVRLVRATLTGALMDGADLRCSDTAGVRGCAVLSLATLRGVEISRIKAQGADFSGAFMECTSPRESRRCVKLEHADLRGANFSGTQLPKASLFGSDLRGANFYEAWLVEADLSDTNLGCNSQVTRWSEPIVAGSGLILSHDSDRQLEINYDIPPLRCTSFRGAILRSAVIAPAQFTGVDLCFADLRGAFLDCAWSTIGCIAGANVAGVRPREFMVWACQHGAVTFDQADWERFRLSTAISQDPLARFGVRRSRFGSPATQCEPDQKH
jgi:uncharacterized protein YjbI with pentapeptide repeats